MLPSIMAPAISLPSLVKVQVVTVAFLPVVSHDQSHDYHMIRHIINHMTFTCHTLLISGLDDMEMLLGFADVPQPQRTKMKATC